MHFCVVLGWFTKPHKSATARPAPQGGPFRIFHFLWLCGLCGLLLLLLLFLMLLLLAAAAMPEPCYCD